MKKYLLLLLVSIALSINAQEIVTPKNYSIVKKIKGDLNNDGIDEIVIAYNTQPNGDEKSVERELVIYKKNNKIWEVWKKSKQVLYKSLAAGRMGDPLNTLSIKKGKLHVTQSTGGGYYWGSTNTDVYKLQQNEFYLTEYDEVSGTACKYYNHVNFNISTGKIIAYKYYDNCKSKCIEKKKKINKETITKKGLKITLQSRTEKKLKIVTPKYKYEINI